MGHGSLKVSDRNWIRGLYRRGFNDRELASLASFRFGVKGDAVKGIPRGARDENHRGIRRQQGRRAERPPANQEGL
jgi:hypothetical protein